MRRKAQALLELSVFLGLMLIVLLAALNYQRNLREQKLGEVNVFKEARRLAHENQFTRKTIDDIYVNCSGAMVNYSLNVDRQLNRIFQGGQRRTAASSVSIYDSNDEDPPSYEFSYYNTDKNDISKGDVEKKIYVDRIGGCGAKDPEDELKLAAADYIAAAYPVLIGAAKGFFRLMGWDWGGSWGTLFDTGRIVAQIYMATRIGLALAKMGKAKANREALKRLDEQMALWGWRVADESHDGAALSGKKYVKIVTPQIWNVETQEDKSMHYDETQTGDKSTRSVNIGDKTNYAIYRRYDVTTEDALSGTPLPLKDHIYEFPEGSKDSSKQVTIDLSASQSENW